MGLHVGSEWATAEFFYSVTGDCHGACLCWPGTRVSLLGENTKARTAYQDFFALWKDADDDIPILKQARAEYGKLQ
jgi:hypothetical protein